MGYYLLDNPNRHGEHYYRTRYKPLKVIVLHITAGLEDLDMIGRDVSAEQTARYCATTDRHVSWHGGSDSDSFLYLLPASYTAWHASNYNSNTYGWEISKNDISWGDEPKGWVEATLRNAADGIRPVAEEYKIPARLLTRSQVDAGMSGFTYHSRLDPTRRSDPGPDFPIGRFFQLLKGEDDMELSDNVNIKGEHAGEILGRDAITVDGALGYAAASLLVAEKAVEDVGHLHENVHLINDKVNALQATVAEILAEVKQ